MPLYRDPAASLRQPATHLRSLPELSSDVPASSCLQDLWQHSNRLRPGFHLLYVAYQHYRSQVGCCMQSCCMQGCWCCRVPCLAARKAVNWAGVRSCAQAAEAGLLQHVISVSETDVTMQAGMLHRQCICSKMAPAVHSRGVGQGRESCTESFGPTAVVLQVRNGCIVGGPGLDPALRPGLWRRLGGLRQASSPRPLLHLRAGDARPEHHHHPRCQPRAAVEASGGHQQTGYQGELTHEHNTITTFIADPELL